MKSLSPILRNLVAIVSFCLPVSAGTLPDGGEGAAAERAFAGVLAKYGVSGGALAIVRDGKLVASRGFGRASVEAVFPIASCTKPITVAAAMILVREGRLRLDEPAWAIVPEFVPWRRDGRLDTITVRDLIEHSGGWDRTATGRDEDVVVAAMRTGRSTGEVLRVIAGQSLDFAPGSRRQYSNVGALLLGAIVEKVSGQTYEAFVRERVLAPLGMARTGLSATAAVRQWGGAGGLAASMPDLVRFVDSAGEEGWAQGGALHDHGLAWMYRGVDGISVAWAVDSSPVSGDFGAEAAEAILAAMGSRERAVEAGVSPGEGEGAGMRRSRTRKFKAPVYNAKKHRAMVYKKPRIRR